MKKEYICSNGCIVPIEQTKIKRRHMVCVKHGLRIRVAMFTCGECGGVEVPLSLQQIANRNRCASCAKDRNAIKTELARVGKDLPIASEIKETRRGDCKHYQKCFLDFDWSKGSPKLDCFKCRRYRKKPVDLSDYIKTNPSGSGFIPNVGGQRYSSGKR